MWKAFHSNTMRIICILVSLLLILHPVSGQPLGLRLWNFSHYNTRFIWSDARSFCRQENMDLVSIENEKQNQDISSGQGWIGLYRNSNTDPWKWSSRGDKIATFFKWAYGEPDDDEHCSFKYPNTVEWVNEHCDAKHTVMCSAEKLVLVKENKTWEEALEHCRSLGGVNSVTNIYNLATLRTQDDHNYAQERAQQATTDEVWTGLRYLDGVEWVWMGGEPVQYQNIPSCPAVRCGVLEKNSITLFGIRDCSQRKNFFCYKKI